MKKGLRPLRIEDNRHIPVRTVDLMKKGLRPSKGSFFLTNLVRTVDLMKKGLRLLGPSVVSVPKSEP